MDTFLWGTESTSPVWVTSLYLASSTQFPHCHWEWPLSVALRLYGYVSLAMLLKSFKGVCVRTESTGVCSISCALGKIPLAAL
jgi:hypothetical protein